MTNAERHNTVLGIGIVVAAMLLLIIIGQGTWALLLPFALMPAK